MAENMTKHIGIVACSAEGAALCYRTICVEGAELMGGYAHPEVTMHTFSLSEYMGYVKGDDWGGVADLITASAEKVAEAGADFAICPDNTVHQAFDQFSRDSSIPWLHIAEVVAAEAGLHGYSCIGVSGTRYLMESGVYTEKFDAVGINSIIPHLEDRVRINDIIFDELVHGHFLSEARRYFIGLIRKLKEQGCDAVVLGCTELPLLISQYDSPLPVLDSTRLLARAALKNAIRP